MREASVTEDATTERPDIDFRGGFKPAKRIPTTGNLSVALGDWVAITENGSDGEWFFRVFLHTGDDATAATLGTKAIVKGLLAFLGDNLQAGADVSAAVTTQAEVIDQLTGRTFQITTGSGGNEREFRFELDTREVELTVSGRLVEVYLVEVAASPDGHSESIIQGINDLLDTTTQVVSVNTAEEKPPFGDKTVPLLGESLELDRLKLEADSDHVVVTMADENDAQKRVIVGQGYSVPYASLRSASPSGFLWSPKSYGVDVVSFSDEDFAGGVRLRNPIDQIPIPGDRVCTYHNRGTTSREIRDWDNDNICTLLPGERVSLRTIRRGDGTGELTDAIPFVRSSFASGAQTSATSPESATMRPARTIAFGHSSCRPKATPMSTRFTRRRSRSATARSSTTRRSG